MKTKQVKEESDRSLDEDTIPELNTKTRARKKAAEVEQIKASQDEPKTSKEPNTRKNLVNKPTKKIIKKPPLGIRKTLRNKKVITKDKIKNVIKQVKKRGKRPAIKVEPNQEDDSTSIEKETVQLISPSDIKKEPLDEASPSSRSSSPKTGSKRQRLSSDMLMMKSLLADTPSNVLLGPRTSPYSMRSERSNSPSTTDSKNLRSGKPRKIKTNLLNKVVKNEQKKRRLMSDSKIEQTDGLEDGKKRGRSYSRDGSEISKCSDITESDVSLSETVSSFDADSKTDSQELIKKIDKSKTDIDVDIESSIPISTINTKVPFFNDDSKLGNVSTELEHNILSNESNKKMSLKRSTSLDSDNNNSRNRLKIDNVHNSSDVEDKSKVKGKTDNDALFKTRSSILTSMSKTFNTKEVSKNIRKARRGRKAAGVTRTLSQSLAKNGPTLSSVVEPIESGPDTLETLSNEIKDLISTLEDEKPQGDDEFTSDICIEAPPAEVSIPKTTTSDNNLQTKSVSKFYGLSEVKPLADNNTNTLGIDTSTKDKDSWSANNNITLSKMDNDSENIILREKEDCIEKATDLVKDSEGVYKCPPAASIDKLMDRLKVFEEFDKKRQTEMLMKSGEGKSVMVTSDVVLIPKSGADIKPLKDIQTVRSPEKTPEKENVLSCFENNSAISIVKKDQVRKSMDVELPNSITLIKRNSIHARKESTGSNHSRESNDALTMIEKSLGKDVTLTEISRKSVDKSLHPPPVEVHQFATLQSNSSGAGSPAIIAVNIDTNQISITPRTSGDQVKQINSIDSLSTKRRSRDSIGRKSSEITTESDSEKLATIRKIASTVVNNHQIKSPPLVVSSLPPVAVKSPEAQPMDTEALAPPLESVKTIRDNISMTSETPKVERMDIPESSVTKLLENVTADADTSEIKTDTDISETVPKDEDVKMEVTDDVIDKSKESTVDATISKETDQSDKDTKATKEIKIERPPETPKPIKSTRSSKSTRASLESKPGPSNVILESPESQKRKENVLRTLGLLTHKAASEAKLEKQKEKERMYAKTYGAGGYNKNKAPKSSGDYTGTLKTIIKLNRGPGESNKGKKYRSSLKITFQKSKNRTGKPAPELGEADGEDEAFYTIERRDGVPVTGGADGSHRKSHYSNRFNNHEVNPAAVVEPAAEVVPEPIVNLVIPEKASSFSIHPGRLCRDQCVYCGGKFGLFDTPSHVAQMKSTERQKKVLLHNEEKLTIDSCLCDACYRHVDRRANCPSYRKRGRLPATTAAAATATTASPAVAGGAGAGEGETETEVTKREGVARRGEEESPSPPLDEESEEETATVGSAICHAAQCGARAAHSIRRKWLIKMRTRVNALLKLELDYPGLHTIPLCTEHHRALLPLMTCQLCRRRINKHHNLHLVKHGYLELNPLLAKEGIPVQFEERPVLCKLCRYYCTLLQRPGYNDKHAKVYRVRLLQIFNIEVPPEAVNETEENKQTEPDLSINSKQKKKSKIKSKQRKSSEPSRSSEEMVTEPIVEIQEGDRLLSEDSISGNQKTPANMEEDIESLISSNKILIPSKPSSGEGGIQSDTSDQEMMQDLDGPLIPLDKQTELQYLLQKQNNPAQFLHKPTVNLTQKSKNIFKMQTTGILKPSQQQKIHEKNTKRIQKLGQVITSQKDKVSTSAAGAEPTPEEVELLDMERIRDAGMSILRNISLNDECTIETVPNKKPADINTLKNKWQMTDSFTQVKKNLSELSKKLSICDGKRIMDMKYSNPVKRLETNPSISVRELFPGEEEMNLHCNIEFSNVKGVTPEGWEKCNSTIQYDGETKKLWNDLQRPYGNQSSFLRHLVLLEKYFRSGDLVLAHGASQHAANYGDSVQSRLRAYDNVPHEPRRGETSTTLMEYRKKPSMNGKSLLKSNQISELEKTKSPEMKKPHPPATFVKPKPAKSLETKSKSKPLPPELIAINTPNAQGRKAIQNVLHNIQQLVKGVSASDPTEIAAAPLPLPLALPVPKLEALKLETPKVEAPNPPKKQRTTRKPWRPTLIPITPENLAKIAREPSQVAVDGRNLPSLVQVMSSGNRYHITLQDYNKMCVMRREKLQRLQGGECGAETVVTEIQPSALLGNGGLLKQTVDKGDVGSAAATILKNVGLKNITIAPVVTSPSPAVAAAAIGPALPKLPKSLTVIPQPPAPPAPVLPPPPAPVLPPPPAPPLASSAPRP